MIRKALLVCGVLASVVYVAGNILGALRWPGYNWISQTISELSAIGAPSRPLLAPLGAAYGALILVFGLGVLWLPNPKPALQTIGGLIVAYGAVCLTGPLTPMHLRGAAAGRTLTDALHIAATTVDVLFILVIIAFGATVFGGRFRLYSFGTIAVLLVFGALAGAQGPRIAANLPTPWAGLEERVSVYGALLWFAVLAVALLRTSSEVPRLKRRGARAAAGSGV
ncbi:MAG TPA: DUF998 domain-containing protein [Gemmatimonadales bacterium]|nr:DUF998 domain-containing protein [Gemmatimonadales bacterium]